MTEARSGDPTEKSLPLCVDIPLLREVSHSLYTAQGNPPFEVVPDGLSVDVVSGFVARYLLEGFDAPTPIPALHRAIWDLVTSPYPHIAIAAPRDHAKTTAVTMSYVLASVLFKASDHVMLVSDTEGQASMFLQDITRELHDNEDIKLDFGIKGFVRETLTEIVVEFEDGDLFRLIAKGAEQRVRGVKWRNKRPNLIVMDDCESDEQVESQDRRTKLRTWMFNALIPAGSARCRIRVIGTVMHFDSLLYRLLHDPNWVGVCFKAHDENFENILWMDRWPEDRLRELRKVFARQNNLAGFSREYLNEPIDESDSYFRRSWIKYYDGSKLSKDLTYYISSDFAISTRESADFSVFVVVGIDDTNRWHIVDIDRGRWDSSEIMDRIFALHEQYDSVAHLVEDGLIWKALQPIFNTECLSRIRFPRIVTVATAGKDKVTRARAFQSRFKAGGVLVDREAVWYDDLYFEMMRFPRAPKDDQVDALAHLGMFLESLQFIPMGESTEKNQDMETIPSLFVWDRTTANAITGY